MGRIVDDSEVILELGLAGSITETERAIVSQCITKAEGAVQRHLKYNPLQSTHTEYYPQMDFTLQSRSSVWEVTSTDAYLRRLTEAASDELQLKHIPIRSITSLNVDYDGRAGAKSGAFGAGTAYTQGTDFWANYDSHDSSNNKVCRDGILRSEGRWPSIAGSVKIVYIAGYSLAELHGQDAVIDASPIVEAIIDEAVRRVKKIYSRMKRTGAGLAAGPFTSESLGDYSYSIDASIQAKLVGTSFDILPETEIKLQDFVNYGWSLAS